MNPLVWIGNVLRWIGGLLAPMFVRPSLSPGVLWTLHWLIITGITIGLWFLQRHYGLPSFLRGPHWFKPFWLPSLFLLLYFLTWQAWWLWKLFQPGEIVSPFPDIDEAWSGILEALDKAGIGVADTAIYVMIGQPPSGESTLFASLSRGLTINGSPSGAAPIRVYANRDAIYLVCSGVTLLGRASRDQGGGGSSSVDSAGPASVGIDASIGMNQSIGMSGAGGGSIQEVQRIIRNAQEQGRPLTEQEKQRIRVLSGEGGFDQDKGEGPGRITILQDAVEVERQTARMHYFCSLVAQMRWPLCPINGAIVVVSVADAERDEIAQQLGLIAQKDLANMVDSLRLKFPVYTLIRGLESLPGGGEFLQRFAVEQRRQQRLGKGFPLNPDLKPTSVPDAIETNVNWIFSSLLPYWVNKNYHLETPNVESAAEASRSNGELLQFLVAVRERSPKIARMVSRAAVPRSDELPAFGGCYLTAQEAGGEALFVQDFFKKVESTQGFVCWTDEAYALDAGYRSAAKVGYLALTAIIAATVALAVYVWGFRTGS